MSYWDLSRVLERFGEGKIRDYEGWGFVDEEFKERYVKEVEKSVEKWFGDMDVEFRKCVRDVVLSLSGDLSEEDLENVDFVVYIVGEVLSCRRVLKSGLD